MRRTPAAARLLLIALLVLGCGGTATPTPTPPASRRAAQDGHPPQWHECRIDTVSPERVAGPVVEADTQAREDALCGEARARGLECPSDALQIIMSGTQEFSLFEMNRDVFVGR